MDIHNRIMELLTEEDDEHSDFRDMSYKLIKHDNQSVQLMGIGQLLLEILDELRAMNHDDRYDLAKFRAEREVEEGHANKAAA